MGGINPGIRKMVALLNSHGWETCDSGDGETRDFECDRDVGYVVVKLDHLVPNFSLVIATTDVFELLREYGIEFDGKDALIQGSYSPVDGVALIDIHGVHDRMLTS